MHQGIGFGHLFVSCESITRKLEICNEDILVIVSHFDLLDAVFTQHAERIRHFCPKFTLSETKNKESAAFPHYPKLHNTRDHDAASSNRL
jgi:hypothetical protein